MDYNAVYTAYLTVLISKQVTKLKHDKRTYDTHNGLIEYFSCQGGGQEKGISVYIGAYFKVSSLKILLFTSFHFLFMTGGPLDRGKMYTHKSCVHQLVFH